LFAHERRGKRDVKRAGMGTGSRGLKDAVKQLTAYFSGKLRDFNLRVAPQGTPFQRSVGRRCSASPTARRSATANWLAASTNPKAVRAVGLANGSNPSRSSSVPPRHRQQRSLVGYGGGLPVKQALLSLERGQSRLL
jgi:methylated-DNA-[protein]-cysteine S-methyltransferase